MRTYAVNNQFLIAKEFQDIETAKQSGRIGFADMMNFLTANPNIKTLLVEKTDRLYRNLKDWVTIEELDLEVHFIKENEVLSESSRSTEKFMHGIREGKCPEPYVREEVLEEKFSTIVKKLQFTPEVLE